ncbi:unnamed protein product, partial [Ixodes persulcatus]
CSSGPCKSRLSSKYIEYCLVTQHSLLMLWYVKGARGESLLGVIETSLVCTKRGNRFKS